MGEGERKSSRETSAGRVIVTIIFTFESVHKNRGFTKRGWSRAFLFWSCFLSLFFKRKVTKRISISESLRAGIEGSRTAENELTDQNEEIDFFAEFYCIN